MKTEFSERYEKKWFSCTIEMNLNTKVVLFLSNIMWLVDKHLRNID